MSGLQEILVIVLIIAFILFLPRLTGRGSEKTSRRSMQKLSGKSRLAIIISVIWLLLSATYLKPWTGELLAFALVGVCPVIIGWGALWVVDGFRKNQNV